MEIQTQEEFLGGGGVKSVTPPPEQKKTSKLKDFGIGMAKGAGDTVYGLGNMLHGIGRGIQAGINPNKTFKDYQREDSANRNLFSNAMEPTINEALESDNKTQTAGKVAEFALEVLFPTSAVLGVGSKLISRGGSLVNKLGSKASGLGDEIVEGGVKVKDKFFDLISTLDEKTKTALERTPREYFESVLKAGQEAMKDDRIQTPLEKVGESIAGGLKQVQNQMRTLGEAKAKVMETANVGFQKVGNIANKTALDIQKIFSQMKLDAGDSKFVNEIQGYLKQLGDNPRLKDVDATIDLIQDKLYSASRDNTITITNRVIGPLREQIGKLNGQVQELGGQVYKKANQEYADTYKFIQELNARLGKESANVGSFVKRLFSPSDANTKKLFEELGKRTGVDYFRDARIAKFIMDTLGDTRVKTLLENLPDSPTGIIGKTINWAKDKISDPIDSAKRFIEKNTSGNKVNDNYSGAIAGLEQDEEGNASFNPLTAMAGVAGLGLSGKKAYTAEQNALAETMDSLTKRMEDLRGQGMSVKHSTMRALQRAFNEAQRKFSKAISND